MGKFVLMKWAGRWKLAAAWTCLGLCLPVILQGQNASPVAPQSSTQRFEELQEQADKASNLGKTDQAVNLYLEAVGLHPQWAEGWHSAGILLAKQKKYSRAVWAFEHYLQLQPKDGDAWTLRGLAEFELRHYSQALDDIQNGRALGVHDLVLEEIGAFHAALVFILKGEFEVAQRLLVQLARQGVQNTELVNAFGLAALRIPRLPDAASTPQQKKLVTQAGQVAFDSVQSPVQKASSEYQALISEYPKTRGLHYAFGDYLLNQAQYEQGLAEMQAELKLNPDDAMALLQASMGELSLDQPSDALPYAEKAVHLAPKLFAAHYAFGLALYRLGRNEEALGELKTAVRLSPNSPQAHYALSRAYLKAGEKQEALEEWNLFTKLKQEPTMAVSFPVQDQNKASQGSAAAAPAPVPQHNAALAATFARAQQDLQKGRYAEAEAGFRDVLKAQPNSASAYCDLGVVCMRTNRIDEAIRHFKVAQKLDPKLAGIDLDLGLAYYQKKDFEHAIPEFEAVVKASPDNTQARYLEGLSRFMLNQYEKTVATLEPLWDKEKSDLDYLFVMGICYGKLKQDAKSSNAFQRLVEEGGDTPHLHLLLGKAYLDLFEEKKAQTELEKAAVGDPKLPYVHYNLGVAYQRLGNLKQAGEEYDKEISINPDDPWAYQNRGTIWLRFNSAEKAVPFFQKALKIDPKLPLSLAGLGNAYLLEGKATEAIPYLKKALDIEPDSANLHYQLGRAYLKANQRAEAQEQFAETEKLQADARKKQADQLNGHLPPPASNNMK